MLDRSQLEAQTQKYLGYLEQDPNNLNLLAEVSGLKLQLGELMEAQRYAEQGLTLSPGDPHFLFQLSNIAIAESRFEDAVRILESIRANGTNAPAVECNLAHALLFLGKYAEARDLLKPIAGAAEASTAPKLLVRAHHYLGEVEEAIAFALAYLETHPEDAEMMGMLSSLYLDNDDSEHASLWAKRATTLNPDCAEALTTSGSIALGLEDEDTARANLSRAVELNPRSGRAWAGLGLTEMLSFDLPKAKQDLQQSVTHMSNHIGTWHALAWCQMMQGDLDGAQESFNKSLDIDHNFAETHGGLASVAAMQGKYDEARRLVEIALRLDPQSYAARFAQIVMLQAQGKQDVAAPILQSALRAQTVPGGGTLIDMLGRVVAKRKGPELRK